MGGGSYTAADWASLRSSRNLNKQQTVDAIFSRRAASELRNSRYVQCRYSRDPDYLREATPIIIGFDVTASMGYLAKELATNGLHSVMTALLANPQIASPQVLCAAIGDCKSDRYPLQVTQFESDIRVIKQLLELYLEGGGGGNGGESYNLLWHFAAQHTEHDHFSKRGKKGYLFTIGNDFCHSGLSAAEIGKAFSAEWKYTISNEELLANAQEKYHVCHIHLENGSSSDQAIYGQWKQLLPNSCAVLNVKDVEYLPELITTIISILNGMTQNEALRQLDQDKAERIARSVAAISPSTPAKRISF